MMEQKINFDYIDDEEKELIESLKDIDFEKVENDIENIKRLKKAAELYMKEKEKQKTITLSVSALDFEKIKAIADKKGLSYQAFIRDILHEVAENYGKV